MTGNFDDKPYPPDYGYGGTRQIPVDDERAAEQRVIRAALSFDSCMGEFEGDMAVCGEKLGALFTVCDKLRKARDAAYANAHQAPSILSPIASAQPTPDDT